MPTSYRARRRLQISPGVFREPAGRGPDGLPTPAELVPEAAGWYRLHEWLHTGYLEQVELTEEELDAAIAAYCPELRAQIRQLSGLDGAVLQGPLNTPRGLGRGLSAGAVRSAQREWALGLDPGPLVGPVPRRPRRGSPRRPPAGRAGRSGQVVPA